MTRITILHTHDREAVIDTPPHLRRRRRDTRAASDGQVGQGVGDPAGGGGGRGVDTMTYSAYHLATLMRHRCRPYIITSWWWVVGEDIFNPRNLRYPKTLAEAVAAELRNPQAIRVEVRHPEGWTEWWYPDGRRERPHPPGNHALRAGKRRRGR